MSPLRTTDYADLAGPTQCRRRSKSESELSSSSVLVRYLSSLGSRRIQSDLKINDLCCLLAGLSVKAVPICCPGYLSACYDIKIK